MDSISRFINLLWLAFGLLCIVILVFIIILNVIVRKKIKKEISYEAGDSEELVYRDN